MLQACLVLSFRASKCSVSTPIIGGDSVTIMPRLHAQFALLVQQQIFPSRLKTMSTNAEPAYKKAARPNKPAPMMPGAAVAIGPTLSVASSVAELTALLTTEEAELSADSTTEEMDSVRVETPERAEEAAPDPSLTTTEEIEAAMDDCSEEMEDCGKLVECTGVFKGIDGGRRCRRD